jgi:hypothetical protein
MAGGTPTGGSLPIGLGITVKPGNPYYFTRDWGVLHVTHYSHNPYRNSGGCRVLHVTNLVRNVTLYYVNLTLIVGGTLRQSDGNTKLLETVSPLDTITGPCYSRARVCPKAEFRFHPNLPEPVFGLEFVAVIC